MAAFSKFTHIHPYQSEKTAQGSLELMYNLSKMLCEITGMDEVTLQPSAGAHGEFTGLMIIRKYHESRGDLKRTKVIVPDSAHGTNPASAHMAGFDIVAYHTPGHTKGGACYYIEEEQVLFSGDTIFCHSVGRTDLPTGSMGELRRSVQRMLQILPDATRVMPGHECDTSIADEKRYNPYS